MQKERSYYGIAVSPGAAVGTAYLAEEASYNYVAEKIPPAALAREVERFRAAVQAVQKQLEAEREKVLQKLGQAEADIWTVQLLLLEDPEIIEAVTELITADRLVAEAAVAAILAAKISTFCQLDDAYMQQRAADLEDLQKRLLAQLSGLTERNPQDPVPENSILICTELSPAEIVNLDQKRVLGVVTAKGGGTSHAAILMRSMGIPAVFGVAKLPMELEPHAPIAVDGTAGKVVVYPEAATLQKLSAQIAEENLEKAEAESLLSLPAVTRDGCRIELAANIGSVLEAFEAEQKGVDGIGLFRTEFIFMEAADLPGEAEQATIYQEVAEALHHKPVIVRTLDAGGDKKPPGLDIPPEDNPFLGWRAIRICLDRPELFKTQLKAILRANGSGNLRIMFPMIIALEEVRAAKKLLAQAAGELQAEGVSFNPNYQVGVMVETPAAVLLAAELLQEVDFVSIGTNDLTQYTLAVDRLNEQIAGIYDYFHPAVLRQLKMVCDAGTQAGKMVGLCGEMAADPLAAPVLVGLGVTELSVNISSIGKIKKLIRSLSYQEAVKIAAHVLALKTATEIKEYLGALPSS